MVRVTAIPGADLTSLLDAGFRERPEEWNRVEVVDGVAYPKRVFAPPIGCKPINVHVRKAGSATARYALLFRDYMRSDQDSRDSWGQFKTRLAETEADIYVYGAIGIDLSIKTDYTTESHLDISFNGDQSLCGRGSYPRQNPYALMARPWSASQ